MIFFYAGLGFAMMTTVLAIFETSTTINKNQYTIKSISDNSDKIILERQNNQKFIQMLFDIKGTSLGTGLSICRNIKDAFTDELHPNYSILSKYSFLNNYSPGIPSYSSHPRLKDGCDLVNDFHRVILVPSSIESNNYNLFSCIIDIEPKCPYELIN